MLDALPALKPGIEINVYGMAVRGGVEATEHDVVVTHARGRTWRQIIAVNDEEVIRFRFLQRHGDAV